MLIPEWDFGFQISDFELENGEEKFPGIALTAAVTPQWRGMCAGTRSKSERQEQG